MTAKQTVRDGDGNRYLLLKQSAESSLVRDPATGERCHLPNERLEPVEDEEPLSTYARTVHADVRSVLTAVRDDTALGLLLAIDASGPVDVRTLLSETTLCESDLHGLLAEFKVAGLIEETTIVGERGYDTTDRATGALDLLRRDADSE